MLSPHSARTSGCPAVFSLKVVILFPYLRPFPDSILRIKTEHYPYSYHLRINELYAIGYLGATFYCNPIPDIPDPVTYGSELRDDKGKFMYYIPYLTNLKSSHFL